MLKIELKKLDPRAVIPSKAHLSDAGYDLTAVDKKNDEHGNLVYDTKISISIPEGYVGLLFPRSSISKKSLALANAVGVVDPGYTGPLLLKFKPAPYYSFRKNEEDTEYEAGDRVGQLIIIRTEELEFQEVDSFAHTARGSQGFGSSDKVNLKN